MYVRHIAQGGEQMDPLFTWLRAYLLSRTRGERGQAEVIVILIILFLLWLIVQGRRVVVQ